MRFAMRPLVGLAVLCASVCACEANSVSSVTPPWMRVAWNSEESDRLRGGPWQEFDHAGPPEAGYFALSSDGGMALVGLCGTPQNQLHLIDLVRKTAVRLEHSDPRIRLADPAISYQADRMAFVITPPTYFGISELRVIDFGGATVFRTSSSTRSYRYPAFVRDGARIGYLRDTRTPPQDASVTGRMPEFREFLNYTIFEIDLRTRREAQVTDRPFDSYCGLFADPLERGYFACALGPLEQQMRGWLIGASDDALDYWAPVAGAQDEYTNAQYLFRYGDRIPPHPRQFYSSDRLTRMHVLLAGALEDGGAALAVSGWTTSDPRGLRHSIVFSDGRTATEVGSVYSDWKSIRVSADGDWVVAMDGCEPFEQSYQSSLPQQRRASIVRLNTVSRDYEEIAFSSISITKTISLDQ